MSKTYKGLRIFETGIKTAEENMALDASLLETMKPSELPLLHLYRWKGLSLTYGYFIRPEEFLNLERMQKRAIFGARRPTGGGIVFHLWDLAFSFLLPSAHPSFSLNPLENYRFVNRAVLQAVEDVFGLKASALLPEEMQGEDAACAKFCMAAPSKYDVIWEGKKIAGAAQRKKRQGYLHQGTIALSLPDFPLLEDVLLSKAVRDSMRLFSFAPLGKEPVTEEVRKAVELKLIEKLAEVV